MFGKECSVLGYIICCPFRMYCLAPYTVPLGPNCGTLRCLSNSQLTNDHPHQCVTWLNRAKWFSKCNFGLLNPAEWLCGCPSLISPQLCRLSCTWLQKATLESDREGQLVDDKPQTVSEQHWETTSMSSRVTKQWHQELTLQKHWSTLRHSKTLFLLWHGFKGQQGFQKAGCSTPWLSHPTNGHQQCTRYRKPLSSMTPSWRKRN